MVSTETANAGPTTAQLWTTAWIMTICSVASCVALLLAALDGDRVQAEHLAWLAAAVVSAVVAAACVVLGGIKNAESRLVRRLGQSTD